MLCIVNPDVWKALYLSLYVVDRRHGKYCVTWLCLCCKSSYRWWRDCCVMYDLSEKHIKCLPPCFKFHGMQTSAFSPYILLVLWSNIIFFLHAIYCLLSTSSFLSPESHAAVHQSTWWNNNELLISEPKCHIWCFQIFIWYNYVPLSQEEGSKHPSSLSCGSFRHMPHVHTLYQHAHLSLCWLNCFTLCPCSSGKQQSTAKRYGAHIIQSYSPFKLIVLI